MDFSDGFPILHWHAIKKAVTGKVAEGTSYPSWSRRVQRRKPAQQAAFSVNWRKISISLIDRPILTECKLPKAASFDSSTYATVAANFRPMFTSQREKRAEPHIIALVELDMQKMRVRLVLAPEAIRERMQELEHPKDHYGQRQVIQEVSGR